MSLSAFAIETATVAAGDNGPVEDNERVARVGWLRAAVLGANDGLVSTASLLVGVAAAGGSRSAVLVAGVAGLSAGALSMAAGEYVSVASQRDLERAQLAIEAEELARFPDAELEELAALYVERGLDRPLALEVARAFMQRHALETHAREELGIDVRSIARPTQAAVVSALSFTIGAVLPLLVAVVTSRTARVPATLVVASAGLLLLGTAGARVGGAPPGRAARRVLVGGLLALAVSLAIGTLLGQAV